MTAKNNKPKFSDIYYDPQTICWGHGNNIVGPRLIASIKIRELTPEEDAELKADYEKAEEIYNKLNLNQKFIGGSKDANKSLVLKITAINGEKQHVSWIQTNTVELSKRDNFQYKPAKGKFNINAMIHLVKCGEIILIN